MGKGDREIGLAAKGAEGSSPWQHSVELEARAKRLSLQQPLMLCTHGSVAGESCPVRHITLQGSPLDGLEVKNTAGSRNRTEAATKKALLSLPSRSTSFPSTETGREGDWGGEEGPRLRGRAGEEAPSLLGCAQRSDAPVPATLTHSSSPSPPCHPGLPAAVCLAGQLADLWYEPSETAPFLGRSSERPELNHKRASPRHRSAPLSCFCQPLQPALGGEHGWQAGEVFAPIIAGNPQ